MSTGDSRTGSDGPDDDGRKEKAANRRQQHRNYLLSGRDYSITLIDGTTINCHYSDIISALATKANSDVTLIDPFQLID